MTTFTNEPNGLHATGIEFFQACSRKGALDMELHGLKRRGQSAYSICRQVYGFRGTREKVADLMSLLVHALIDERHGVATKEQLRLLDEAMPHPVTPDCTGIPEPKEAQA
jgi:hypothetical protein